MMVSALGDKDVLSTNFYHTYNMVMEGAVLVDHDHDGQQVFDSFPISSSSSSSHSLVPSV